MSDIVLSVPVDAGGVDPLLKALEKINENLQQINSSSKGSFDIMSKSLDKTNKKLKETDKTFGDIFKKIKLSGLMKMGAGVIGAGAGLLGISTGAMLFGALRNSAGNIGGAYQGKGLGMSSGEMKALQTASKLTTGKEDTLVKALDSLVTAMQTGEGQGAIATLGLSAAQLKGMKPEDALQAVFQSVKGKGTGVGFEYLQKAFTGVTGLSDKDYAVATKEGASFEAFYNEFLSKYGDVDFDALLRGSESMVKFQTSLDITSEKLGSKLADPLSSVLDKLTPYIDKLADALASLLGSITQEDVDNFARNIQAVFSVIASLAGGLLQDTSKVASTGNAYNKAVNEGDYLKLAGLGTNAMLQAAFNLLTPEGRAKNEQVAMERSVQQWMDAGYYPEQIRRMNPGLVKEMEAGGYVSGADFTDKAKALHVSVTINDKTSGGIVPQVQAQGTTTPNPSTRKGGR